MSNVPRPDPTGGASVTDDAESKNAGSAGEVDPLAELVRKADQHATPATEASKRKLAGLARSNSQIHAQPRPGVDGRPHGQNISGRSVRRGDLVFRGLAVGSGG